MTLPQPRTPKVPVAAAAGRPVEEVAQLYRDDGFQVQVIDLDVASVMTADFRPDRIRLLSRGGVVERAQQG